MSATKKTITKVFPHHRASYKVGTGGVSQGDLVKMSADGEVVKTSANTDIPVGVAYEDADAGEYVTVIHWGIAEVNVAAGTGRGILLMPSDTEAGKAEALAAPGAAAEVAYGIIGTSLTAESGGKCTVLVNPNGIYMYDTV